MRVLVFDIDGTLTETNRVDTYHYESAVRSAFPDVTVDSVNDFAEFTDAGILREIWERHGAGEYEPVERQVEADLIAGLTDASRRDPGQFAPVPGAREIFSAVQDTGWIPAMATGAWRRSATLKLDVAAIPVNGVPLATSSERTRRADIIRLAVQRAARGVEPEEVVYVGDGTWDLRACSELGIGFVGRITPGSGPRLAAAGVTALIPDYGEPENLLELLTDPGALVP